MLLKEENEVRPDKEKKKKDTSKKDAGKDKQGKHDKKKHKEAITFKHNKDGLSIHITIYNTNNLANEGGNAGLKQEAETGGQIVGSGGQNANQGGQIAEKCGQNANQDGQVESKGCGKADDKKKKHKI